MQKKRMNGPTFRPIGGVLAGAQGFPPLSSVGFSTSLPVYVGARANIWGMDGVSKDKFKRDPKEELVDEAKSGEALPIEEEKPIRMLKDLKKEPRQKQLPVNKTRSPDDALRMQKKIQKLAALSSDFEPSDHAQPPLRSLFSSDSAVSDMDSENETRPVTSESGRRSPPRVLRPPSPTDDANDSLGNLVTPLRAAPRRKAAVMVSKSKNIDRNAKYIPKKVNLPRQMSHLFRSDANAIAEVAIADIHEMSYLEIPSWHKYFGDGARISFQRDYEIAHRNLNKVVDGQKNFTASQSTPRSKYLREVAHKKLPPLPLLMRKQEDPKTLNISHKGIGDDKMIPLVNIIEKLPLLQSLIICDNRLTDVSLTPLMLKLRTLPILMHLDLSYNKIDACSQYLMSYLREASCQLQILVLNGSDVDDVECTHIAEALTLNTSLLSLSLKNNKIGTAELQNVATPNFVTGGEAIGRMLLKNKSILELDLSWNYIRLDSACAVAEALIANETLRVLRVAHNGFGELGTQVMGVAIKQNARLQVLDMSYNQITPKAAAVLQNGLVHNDKINTLILDGNVLGQIGARALVSAVQRASGEGRILRITFVNCDCEKELKGLFDASSPGGSYTLDLSEPYGQMVAEECLYLLDYRVGCELKRIEYSPKLSIPFKTLNLEREKVMHKTECAPVHMKRFCDLFLDVERDQDTLKALDALLACFDLYPAHKLLRRILEVIRDLYAERESLAVTNYQRKMLLPQFEQEMLLETFKALFRIADDDMSGEMCIEEFYSCLDSLSVGFDPKYTRRLFVEFDKDNSGNIDEEEFGMIMVNEFCRSDATRGCFIQRETRQPWPVPSFGILKIDIEYQCEQANLSDIAHDEGISNVIAAIRESRTEAERIILFEQAISSPYYYMSAQQALMLYEEVSKHVAGNIDVIGSMLPQIVNAEQRVRFVDTLLDSSGKLRLRVKLGQMYNCLMGLPTGFYSFDLSTATDRNMGRALATIWGTEVKYSKSINCNTSQKGNFSNFRNEMLGANHIEGIDSTWFSRCPQSGKLSLDYVSTSRARMGTTHMPDARFKCLKKSIGFEIIREFYGNPDRLRTATLEDLGIPREVNIVHIKEVYYDFLASSHHAVSIYPKEVMRDVSRTDFDPEARPETPDILKLESADHNTYAPIYSLAYYKLLQLQLLLPTVWFSGQQAKDIIEYFPEDGYIRVQAFISLFSRIVEFDENVSYIIKNIFSVDEKNEIYHRLGCMNVLDPLYSNDIYKLDLRRWDHRELCRAIVRLAIDQPGENLGLTEYRWSKYDSSVPGWALPMNWVSPDEENGGDGGPRKFGWCVLEYFSTGLHHPGVKRACFNLRKNFHAGALRPVL